MLLSFSFKEKDLPDRRADEVPREFDILCAYDGEPERKVGFFVITDETDGRSHRVQFLITETDVLIRRDIADACELPIAIFTANFSEKHFCGRSFTLENIRLSLASV